ncbi:hypothetical protein DH2020_005192 [Rehmannia glutinosa]|uniref:F-box protein n=1 Tax=Rehmannia glutinosa TaxID=99300 RepID=A0ABR0XRK5_REHGL
MAGAETQELGKLGKRKANTGDLGDGPSSLPSLSSFGRVKGHMTDGGGIGDCKAEIGGGEKLEVAAAEESLDPLVVFGSGIMMMILSKLDARSVAISRLVSNGWLEVASADKIWAPKCQELWLGKAHIPRISKDPGISKMAATSLSIMDGKRTRITRNDMCDHIWEFHFTEAAPEYWRNLDPYWQGTGPPMRRYFHPDGSITADPDDKVWGGHESSYTIVTGLLTDGKIREHYVRINRWQKMAVQRKPDWSWVLSNHLYYYSSLPDADKQDGTGPFFPVF